MVAIIDKAGFDCRRLPMELEAWLRLGNRLAFDCADVGFSQFGPADNADLYHVRNHPTVRTFLPSPAPLPVERHRDWVRANLLDIHAGSPLVLLGRIAGEPVAFGLLKPVGEAGALELGVMVAGPAQRSALAPRLGVALLAIAARVFGAHTIVSHVNHAHGTALRLNQGAGLRRSDGSTKPGEMLFRTPLPTAMSTPLFRKCTRELVIRIEAPAAE